jgi:hypothetical protein
MAYALSKQEVARSTAEAPHVRLDAGGVSVLEEHGLTADVRSQLTEYYKWIVSLATFVLTVSISMVSLFGRGVQHKWLLVVGWILLGLCVFLDWLLVKRLVSIPIVAAVAPEDEGRRHQVFKATLGNMQVYGFLQNLAFLIGVLCVGIALIINIA